MSVNVAIVGAGYWGPNLIRIFSSLPECRVASVCDVDADRLAGVAEKYPGIFITTCLSDVLSDSGIDAVAITTPAESHLSIAEASLRAGKHVYVEKPLAENSRDAETVVRLSRDVKKTLMVGHIFLYDSAIINFIRAVQAGDIGSIHYVHVIRTSMAGTARLDTNIVWDALVHDAYILPAVFGCPPQRVLAAGAGYLKAGLEDVAFVTLDFGDDRLAQVYVSWYALEKARQITAVGSQAILVYNELSQDKLVRYARRYEQSQEHDTQGRPRWQWKDEGKQSIVLPKVEPLRAECQHFIECIITNKIPLTDGQAGLEAVRVLEACQNSLDHNNIWMEINHE